MRWFLSRVARSAVLSLVRRQMRDAAYDPSEAPDIQLRHMCDMLYSLKGFVSLRKSACVLGTSYVQVG